MLDVSGPAPLRGCEKIENSQNLLLQVFHSQGASYRFRLVFSIFSQLLTPVVDMAAMLRLLFAILVASLVAAATGCSGGADIGKGYNSKSGDLGAFILSSAPKFGVRLLTTNGLPHIRAKWRYKESSNEFQLFVEGDYFPQLHAFLTKAVGPPPGPPVTNSPTQLRSIEAYYGTNSGAVVNCAWEIAEDGKQYTHFLIVGYGRPTITQNQVAQFFKAISCLGRFSANPPLPKAE